MKVFWTLFFSGIVTVTLFAFSTPFVRIADVKNGELSLRHYYDYRNDAKVITYFAEMVNGKPTGKLYAVELRGSQGFSRNQIVQFSEKGVYDFNPGTRILTAPQGSPEATTYEKGFTEVRGMYENRKWWQRKFHPL